ncbi:MAG TPA: hypothetical protein VK694_04350 [Verrucomicrobiae bacterium]|nr:hypothetical protein [Verrucomicrobiae bacterium]
MSTLLAHNGQSHEEAGSSATGDSHQDEGHVQASTTQPEATPTASSSNLPLVGGIVVVAVVAAVIAWVLLNRKKASVAVEDSSNEE